MKLLITILAVLIITSSSFSETTYTWTGAVNSSLSTAGNWSPNRQVGLTSDILVFSTGTSLNVTNVSQVTIGQLIVRNNTNLMLSPATGNDKTIFINGGTGDDFIIEQGSSLVISASTPQLNLNVKTGATAKISGTLTFTGSSPCSLTAADSLSIAFKQGSILNQYCPGSIFTTAGMKNIVIFEDGSSMIINNINAVNPFGLTAPNSKVVFQHGSNFKLDVNSANALSLSGRTYSNIVMENNINLVINEYFTLPLTIDNLNITNNCTLAVKNTNWNTITDINIKGDLLVNGMLGFNDSSNHKDLEIDFKGDQESISGTGDIEFGNNLKAIKIYSVVTLHRNITALCPVFLFGQLHTSGYSLRCKVINGGGYDNLNPGSSEITANEKDNKTENVNGIPTTYSISQNYPNPFNPSTKIDYTLPVSGQVSIKVFDSNGREVGVLVDKEQEAGSYTLQFNASHLSSGIYFYTITTSSFSKTLKMILVK